jgi:hypothetical protein
MLVLQGIQGPASVQPMTRYLLIIIAILSVFVLSEFLFEFYQVNKEQDCLAAGGRRCGPTVQLSR